MSQAAAAKPKFLVTDESGRLARWLRLAGYDTAQRPAQPFSALYRQAYHDGRIVVTRNGRIGASCLFRVVRLTSHELNAQLQQLMRELGLMIRSGCALTRCDQCNVRVEPVEKSAVAGRVPPYVFQTQPVFHECPRCRRIYWMATHVERIARRFERLGKSGDEINS